MYLDSIIYNFIYRHCYALGKVFGYGALEGFIMYLGIIVLGVVEGTNLKKHDK